MTLTSATSTTAPSNARFAVSTVFFVNGAVLASWVPHIPTISLRFSLGEGALGLVLLAVAVGAVTALSQCGRLIARFGSGAVTRVSTVLFCVALPLPLLAPSLLWLLAALALFGMANGTMDVAMNAQAARLEHLRARPIMSSFHALFSLGGLVGAGTAALFLYLETPPNTLVLVTAGVLLVIGLSVLPYLVRRSEKTTTTASHDKHDKTTASHDKSTDQADDTPGTSSASDATSNPASNDLASDDPASDDPTSNDSASDNPASDDPTSDDPTSDDLASDNLASDNPASNDLASDDPASNDSASDDPTSDDSASDDPASNDPASDNPASADPASATETPAVRRTLVLLGTLACVALISEGAMVDWSALYMSQLGANSGLAATAFAALSFTMMVGRFSGDHLRSRFGATGLLRYSALIAALGLAFALLVPTPRLALPGFAAVGLGLANLVPLLLSAAANLPGIAPEDGLAAVATAGYVGFLVGPPLIGLTAELTSLGASLGLIAVALLLLVPFAEVTEHHHADAVT